MGALGIDSCCRCNFLHVVDLLIDPSDGAGAGEKALPVRPSSASCSRSTLEYFESRTNFGTESCTIVSSAVQKVAGVAYTRHKLEYRDLCVFEELDHLAQTLEHRLFITNRTSHPAGQTIAQGMVNIELAR
jgi:hypothetical protein